MSIAKTFKRLLAPFSLVMMVVLLSGCSDKFIVLDPKGPVGQTQKDLMILSSILCTIILIPVLAMTAVIVWRYRDKPKRIAKYAPEWSHSTKLETIWWSIPIVIIAILGVITVDYTYKLEPSKALASEQKPIVIQATSLDWKWLFTYPEQGISTVNYIEFPEGVPVKFQLTSDAPMNSFWIPQLGGQMYTMSGMAMTLHLQADEKGTYFGSGANFSGKDFAKMRFEAKATTQDEFDTWVKEVKSSSPALTKEGYDALQKPGTSDKQTFSSFPEGLFESIVTKYGTEGHHHHGGDATAAETNKSGDKAPAAKTNDSKSMSGHDMSNMPGMNHSGH